MRLRFADFEIDLDTSELLKNGARVPIQDKPFRILAMLLTRPGQLVTRMQIIEEIWADAYVSEDQSLNTAVRKIRLALTDAPDSPRFVETVGSRGYRFIYPIEIAGPTPSAPRVLTLAVLPLENLGDQLDEHITEGLTERMISQLGRIHPNVAVIGLPSVLRYKDRDTSISEVVEALGADFILYGSLRQANQRLRIAARLINAADQSCVWSETFEGELSDIFVIQNEVAERVAHSTARLLAPAPTTRPATSIAHETYLRGRFFWNKRKVPALLKSVELFNQAIDEDPNHAPSYVGLADANIMLVQHGVMPGTQAYPVARDAALKALALDSNSTEAHVSLAWVKCVYERDCKGAEYECQTALELNPSYSFAYAAYTFLLTSQARHDEAVAMMKRGLLVDPISLLMNSIYAATLYFARRYAAAVDQCKECIDLDPSFSIPHAVYGQTLEAQGDFLEASEHYQKHAELAPLNPSAWAYLGRICARRGLCEQAVDYLHKLLADASSKYVSPYLIAQVYTALGDKNSAFKYLEQASEQRSNWIMFVGIDPALDSLHSDPRFLELLKRLGLPEAM